MTTTLITLLIGAVLGALAVGLVLKAKAPGMMLMEDRSALDFEATVKAVEDGALAAGWQVPSIHRIHETLAEAGHDVRPTAVIELCKGSIAARVLGDEAGRRVAPMMPCRVAVYENADGSVSVSRLNSTAMSRLFGGVIETAMTEAAAENETIFAPLLATSD